MDIIAATFHDATEASSAARDMESELHIEDGSIAVDPVPDHPVGSAGVHLLRGAAILVACVEQNARARARDVIGRHGGRHLPLDWIVAILTELDPGDETVETIRALAIPQGDVTSEGATTDGASRATSSHTLTMTR